MEPGVVERPAGSLAVAPTFSILLPTRNRQRWLDCCVASILNQTRHDWELVVVDNSDEPQRLPDDERIRRYFAEQRTIPELYNLALAESRGKIICYVGDDDRLPPDALEVAALSIGDADWLVGKTVIEDEGGNQITTRGGTRDSVEATRRGTYMLGGAVYWRRSLTDELGGFRVEYDGAGDYELFSRFLRHSEPVVVDHTMYLYTDWPGTDSNVRAHFQQQQSARIARGD